MANTLQAKKRIRRNDRRTAININRLSRIRTYVKKVDAAVAAGDKSGAAEAFKTAKSEIAKGVTKGVFHKNTASRKISRLETRINSIAS